MLAAEFSPKTTFDFSKKLDIGSRAWLVVRTSVEGLTAEGVTKASKAVSQELANDLSKLEGTYTTSREPIVTSAGNRVFMETRASSEGGARDFLDTPDYTVVRKTLKYT